MVRVSLTEDYDDRSVIAKLNEMDKRVKENTTVVTSAEASAKASAQAAQETADRFAGSVGAVVQNANQQINASKAQVDQAKAEVDAAVATMATYDTRLTAVEDADANNVKLHPSGDQHVTGTMYIDALNMYGPQQFKLRGTQTDGWKQIGISDSQGDVTKIQMNRNEIQLVGNNVYRDTVPSNADSRSIVNKAYVESTDGETNNLVHKTANETIGGVKRFTSTPIRDGLTAAPSNNEYRDIIGIVGSNKYIGAIFSVEYHADGSTRLYVQVRNANGTTKDVILAEGNR